MKLHIFFPLLRFFRVWIRGGDKVKADVVYIDYGNTETIDYSKLSGLPDRFWDLPPQAVPFRIQGIYIIYRNDFCSKYL